MPSITIEEAQARLPELIAQLLPGEELYITEDDHSVARLVRMPQPPMKPREPGLGRGQLIILQEDEEHLEDFKDYMPPE